MRVSPPEREQEVDARLALEAAFQARRHPGLLQVEPLEHGPRRFVLDAACAPRSAIQGGPLRRQHFAQYSDANTSARGACDSGSGISSAS